MDIEKNIMNQMESQRPDFDEIPDFLREVKWYDIDTSGLLLDFSEPYHPPKWTLSHNNQRFANLGDLHVITGKSGHGKTSLMSIVMAAILKGRCGNLRYELSDTIANPVVLYIDTEMGKDDTIAIKNRVCVLAGLDYTQQQKQFKIARLRDTQKASVRWQQILKLIYEVRPNICMIDGMLDIVSDYNSQEECTPIIRECMMTATHYNISMWCVLHENPTFDKMVGTLGSILQRKVTEVFAVRKHDQSKMKPSDRRDDRPKIYFSVEQLKARGKDVDGWDFEVTSESGWGIPHELTDKEPAAKFTTKVTPEQLKEWIIEKYNLIEWPATRSDFSKIILEQEFNIKSEVEQKELIQMALNRRFLLLQDKSEKQPGQTNLRLKLNEEEITPF